MSLKLSYFQDMYDASTDPWGFTERWYEQRKYALTLACLPRHRYRRAFEPGCSIGVLTAMLAERCDSVAALDPIPDAVAAAGERNRDKRNVRIEVGELAGAWPTGHFDLIVLSEVAYYLDDDELRPTLQRAADALTPGGDLVAAHWLHRVPEYPQAGETVHAALAATVGIERLTRHEERDFLLEVFTRSPGQSVAQREGLC